MALPAAQQIIRRAEAGEKITRKDRMHAIGYLMATESRTDTELAELFKVTPRQIRFDKQDIKKEKVDILKEENVALVIVDLQMNIERQIRDLERSKSKCKEGTDLFMKHCNSIAKLQLELNSALRDLGWLPKNIGNMTVTNFKYEAIVNSDGSVDTRRVENYDNVIEGEIDKDALNKRLADLDAKFLPDATSGLNAPQEQTTGSRPESTGENRPV